MKLPNQKDYLILFNVPITIRNKHNVLMLARFRIYTHIHASSCRRIKLNAFFAFIYILTISI